MSEWNEICSQATANKEKTLLSKTETYGSAGTEACGAQMAGEARNRRERTRMSDIERSVDKVEGLVERKPNRMFDEVPPVVPGLEKILKAAQTLPEKYDKNTPGSLKQLRWSIYEVIERYEGDYGKMISGCLKQEVERLFQEYTHS